MDTTANYNLNLPPKGHQNWDILTNQNFDKIDTELKNNVNKIGDLSQIPESDLVSAIKVDRASLNDIVQQDLPLKADKTYVDTKTAAIASGSPKGVYATVTALQTAYPTGTTGIYLVTADGGWYYWSGSAWSKGGTYQGTGIVNGSIDGDKTDFLTPNNINLFNVKTATLETYVKEDGTIGQSGMYAASDFIEVKPNTTYKSSSELNKAFYDSNKVFVSFVTGATVTSPSNAKYIRVTILNNSVGSYMFVEGNILPATYISYGYYKLSDKITVPGTSVKGLTVNKADCTFIPRVTTNLFDKSKIIPYKYVRASDGVISNTSNYNASDYISIEPNTKYICNSSYGFDAGFYDSNKVYISSMNGYGNASFTTPSNAAYIVFTLGLNEADVYMFVKGEHLPAYYVPFETYKLDTSIKVSSSQWEGKKSGHIGDSITEYTVAHNDGIENTQMNYVDVIRTLIPFREVRNMGMGGKRMCDIVQILQHQGVTDAELASCDLITVYLGANDWATPIGTINDPMSLDGSSFYGSVRGVIDYILTRNPTARLVFFTPLPGNQNPDNKKSNAIKEVCASFGIPVLDLYSTSGFNTYTYSSYYGGGNVHPNSLGHFKIGEQIVRFLNNI